MKKSANPSRSTRSSRRRQAVKPDKAFIVGEKVYLRPLELDDLDLVCKCFNSPDVRPTFFLNTPTNRLRQEEYVRGLYKEKDHIPFIIVAKETDKPIGITAFHRVDLVSRAAVYSIIIADSSDWSKGYGSEVTRLMVEYGFDVLNLNRIHLHVCVENEAGIRAYEKAGFIKEGLLRQAMYRYDRYSDFFVMGILREDYYAR
jgi:RimJ/RimL family protein N-acetyltransferase